MSGIAYAIIAGILSLVGGIAASGIGRRENYETNEQAADNADTRTRNLYTDLQAPKAQISQLKEAGLSPSLFYSGNGNLQGISTGAMGAGASGMGTAMMPMQSPAEIAQIDLIQAQAENQRAQAKKAGEETNELTGNNAMGVAKLALMYSQAGLNKSAEDLNNAKETQTNLENYVKDHTKDLDVEYMMHLVNKMQWDIQSSEYDAKGKKIDFEITEDAKNDIVKSYRLQNSKLLAETSLALANKELTDENVRKIQNDINLAWENYELSCRAVANSEEETKVKKDQLKEARRQFDLKLEAIYEQLYIENGKLQVAKFEAAKKFGKKVTKEVGTRGTFIPYTNITTSENYLGTSIDIK